MLKKITTTILLLTIISFSAKAQITVTNTLTPAELVNTILLGNGVSATNIKYNGVLANANSIKSNVTYFNSNSTLFPLNDGVLLTTGNGMVAVGPNQLTGDDDITGTVNITDTDLSSIASPGDITNGVKLEFDFVATSDSISFEYMFASEEYYDYVGSDYNDAFCFILSGPGIAGTYSNSGINLATLPTTSTATNSVTINNVNNGNSGLYNWPPTNNIYYVENSNSEAYGDAIEYDGTTVTLTSKAQVICGSTYHIKLAIANVFDQAYDSGVFLKGGSFSANGGAVAITSTTITGAPLDSLLLAEGCSVAQILFVRPVSSIDTVGVYPLDISGNLDPATDLVSFSNSVTFPIGVDSVYFVINPIDDGITEVDEVLKVTVFSVSACGDTIFDSLNIYVMDQFDLTFEMPDTITTNCSNINPLVTLTNFVGATGPFTYTWSNGSSVNPTTFTNTGINGDSTYLTVSVMDDCSNVYLDSVLIINDYLATDLSILPNDTLYNNCPTNTLIATVAVDSNAAAPYTYLWSTGSTLATSNVTNNGVNGSVVTYFVSTTNICGMTSIDSVKVINQIVNPIATLMQNDTIYSDCILDSALAVVVGSSGLAPYTYLWNNASINDSTYIQDLIGVNGGSIPFNVTVTDACGNSGVANGVMIVDMTLQATLTQTPSTCNPTGTSTSTVTGSIGTNDYQWIGPGLINPDTLITQNTANLSSGWYYYTVIDDVCSYSDSIFVDLIQSPNANISANPMSTSGPATITFTNTSTLATSYVWDYGNGLTGNTSSLVSTTSIYTEPGFYTITLTAINGGCSDAESVIIEILAQPVIVNEPNVFTPDGDGINDLFFITTLNVASMNLVIMNRWGNILYDETNANPTWDGENHPDGVYYYMYTATGINGEILKGRGFFHLVNNN